MNIERYKALYFDRFFKAVYSERHKVLKMAEREHYASLSKASRRLERVANKILQACMHQKPTAILNEKFDRALETRRQAETRWKESYNRCKEAETAKTAEKLFRA